MKFRNLIIKNISRNKSRSFLAIIGIAIGVAAVIGLGLVTDGLSASTQKKTYSKMLIKEENTNIQS